MRTFTSWIGLPALACLCTNAATVFAQSGFALPEATKLSLDAPITSVTLYTERAMVTRSCPLPNEQGIFEIRVSGLPPAIDGESLAARVEGAKLLDVRYEEIVTAVDPNTNPDVRAAQASLLAAERQQSLLAMRGAKLTDQNALLNAIAQKTATESAKDFGSKSLDTDALAKQVMFLDEARERLIDARAKLDIELRANTDELTALAAKVKALGGARKVARNAVISVGKSAIGAATLSINYLVSEASWAPRYAVRAVDSGDDSTDVLTLEYNAVISQVSGEDWNDVALTLSTAEPTRTPAPPEIGSQFIDVVVPQPPADKSRGDALDASLRFKADRQTGGLGGGGGGFGGGSGGIIGEAGEDPERAIKLGVELERAFADAQAEGSVVVNYALPRAATIPSDHTRTQTQRIATIDLKPEFSHVARPIVDPTVYLRAKARNTSTYRFLDGEARLFVGDDSVGETTFPTVDVGAEMVFWFGGDPRVLSKRTLVSQESKEEGVFGKDSVTTWKWRIDLTSSTQGSAHIELSDRIPVSRNAQVKVELKDLSAPLSTEAEYVKSGRPRGILEWIVDMDGLTSGGKPTTKSVTWTVRRAHPKDVQISTFTQ